MSLSRNNGTSDVLQGKFFRNNGTNDVQIGKIYRSNGTTDSLIHTSEYVFFPSVYVCNKNNWTDHGEGSGTFEIDDTHIYLYGHSKGSDWTLYNYFVDFSKYRKLYINVTSVNASYRNFNIRWREKDTGALKVNLEIEELDAAEQVGIHEIDISGITSQCYLSFKFDNGGGGTITRIWFGE